MKEGQKITRTKKKGGQSKDKLQTGRKDEHSKDMDREGRICKG